MKNSTNKIKERYAAPIIALLLSAPLIAEVLPGATRLSALFVFPIEVSVWGIGALFIRHAVRKWDLSWFHMLLLAAALSIAEEFVIQQSSVAPLVVKIKGETYARAFEINYVYFLWAIIYESVLVVFVPIYLVEMIFPKQAAHLWFGRTATLIFAAVFVVGSFAAWYSWTQIARTTVFNAEPYSPPIMIIVAGVIVIACLIFLAIGPFREAFRIRTRVLQPPRPIGLGMIGAIWAILLYGVLLIAFGIAPTFPVPVVVAIGLALGIAPITLLPSWSASTKWQQMHTFSILSGVIVGAMAAGFVGFIVSTWWDLTFKIVTNFIAAFLLIRLGLKIKRREAAQISALARMSK